MWARPWKLKNGHFVCRIKAKIDFHLQNRKNMLFSLDFLLYMLESDHSNLQTNFWVHITSNIFRIIQFWNHGIAQPPWPPNFESLPYPRGRWWVRHFFAKMRGKDELKGPRSNLPPFLSTGAKTVWGVVATPLRRTSVNDWTGMISVWYS